MDLSTIVNTSTLTMSIALDPRLENVSGITSATVTVTITGLSTRSVDVVNITTSPAPEGYTVTLATQAKSVLLRGTEEDLAAVDASQVRIVADLSEIASVGTYPVPAKVYVDSATVGVVGEYTVIVNVSK